jgi:hypothetical protein
MSYPEENDCEVIMNAVEIVEEPVALVDDKIVSEILAGEDEFCSAQCNTDVDTGKEVCTFTTKLNLFAGELGYYQFEECGDATNPVLGLEVGKTYKFVQKDPSN